MNRPNLLQRALLHLMGKGIREEHAKRVETVTPRLDSVAKRTEVLEEHADVAETRWSRIQGEYDAAERDVVRRRRKAHA